MAFWDDMHVNMLVCVLNPYPMLNAPPQMAFWDDMHMNIEDVARLGVVSVYAPRGLTTAVWDKGLQQYAARHARA